MGYDRSTATGADHTKDTDMTNLTATDAAFRIAQDATVPAARRWAAAAAFQVLTLEDVAASMDIPAETLKARRAELVASNAATLSVVEEMTQRDAERAILAEVRSAEETVAAAERAEVRRARQAELAAQDRVECSRCGGQGGSKSWPGYTCFRCNGSGVDPKPLSEIEASVDTGCRVCGWEDYSPICPSCKADQAG